MLVLSRKVNESILLGDEIEVTIIRVKGGGVRLGILAPDQIKILRKELANGNSNQVNQHSRNQSSLHSVRASKVGENSADSHVGEPNHLLNG